jgi:CBS-domain-containing membrane protein
VGPGRLGSLSVWEVARALSGLTVKDVMIKAMRVITTGQDTPVEEAARVMVERKMGCLPVADGGWQMATISYQFSARGGASWPAVASLRARRGKWDAVVKRAVSQEQMVAALGRPRGIHIPQGRVEGQQIIDVREIR